MDHSTIFSWGKFIVLKDGCIHWNIAWCRLFLNKIHCSKIGWEDRHCPTAQLGTLTAAQYQDELDQQERMWSVKWFVAEPCKTIFNRYVKSLSLLPVICLLSTKACQNDSQSSLHPWWPGWYPEVWLTRSYSLLAQDFLKSSCFFLVIVQPVILY